MRKQQGFTLIELLTAMGLMAVLLTLSAGALRGFWLGRALESGANQVASQMRQVQERSVSETHPLVYGLRFAQGSNVWNVVRYNPGDAATTGDETCTLDPQVLEFDELVTVSAASFATSAETTFCRTALAAGGDHFVFFYARGNATPGTVTLRSSATDSTRTVRVTGLTGRVEED